MPNNYWFKTLFFLFATFFVGKIDAQVKFKVALSADSSFYQVSLLSEIGPFPANSLNFVPSATVTLIAPTGQLNPSSIINQKGIWSGPDVYENPVADLDQDYFVFTLQGAVNDIVFTPGLVVNLFTFTNPGNCAGAVELMDNDNDPFREQDPTANIGNQITVFGNGEGNAYGGAHEPKSANCMGFPPCELSISSVTKVDIMTCGGNNGSITINVANSVGTVMYSIDNGLNWLTTNTFNNLAIGNYSIKVRDDNCEQTHNANPVIISEPNIAVLLTDSLPPSCNTTLDGKITVSASGGLAPYQYSINNGANWTTNGAFTSLGNGIFNVKARNADSTCETSYPNTLVFSTQGINVEVTKSDVSCTTGNLGSIVVSAEGGTGSFQYSIDSGSTWVTTTNFTNLNSGNYHVFARNSNGTCENAFANNPVIISESAINFTVVANNPDCNGGSDGSIIIDLTGETGSFEYSIDNGTNWVPTDTFSNLDTGAYTIKVRKTDGSCETAFTNNPVTLERNAINISVSTFSGGCADGMTNMITVAASGGTGSFQYSKDNGATWQNSNVFSSLANGDYNIKVRTTDLSCETAFTNNPITFASSAINIGVSSNPPMCHDMSNGNITITASGGTGSFIYSVDGGANYTNLSSFSGLANGTYNIFVKNADGTCETEYPTNPVRFNTIPISISVAQNQASCLAAMDGSISLLGNGGSGSYEFSIDSGATWSTMANHQNLAADLYNVQIRNANQTCETVFSGNPVDLRPDTLALSIVSNTPPSCENGNDGSLVLSASGGGNTNYEYSIDDGANFSSISTFQNLSTGDYHLKARIANTNCEIAFPNNPVRVENFNCPNISVDSCFLRYILTEDDGIYTVSLKTDTTWQGFAATTSNAQVSIRVPTGGFSIANFVNKINGVQFAPAGFSLHPMEAPTFDFFAFSLQATTISIPYQKGNTVELFSFENNGICTGGEMYLIGDEGVSDPAIANTSYQSQITVSGWGGPDAPICNSSDPVALCLPPPPCVVNLVLTENNGQFTVGMIPDTTWVNPLNTVNSAQISFRMPAKGYVIENFQNSINQVQFELTSRLNSPIVEEGFDYFSVTLNSFGTNNIPFTKGVKADLFSFEINGACASDSIALVGAGSLFNFPNGEDNNIVSQMTVAGWGSADLPLCVQPAPMPICSLGIGSLEVVEMSLCDSTRGTIIISATCAGSNTRYSVDNGVTYQDSPTFDSLAAGNYFVRIYNDSTDCEVVYDQNPVIINETNPITFVATPVSPTCADSSNGSITLDANIVVGSLLYSIDDGQTWSLNPTFTGLINGNYTPQVSRLDTTCITSYDTTSLTLNSLPCDFDSDNDGSPDLAEDLNMDGNLENDDTDGDTIPNYLDDDDDGDGILSAQEEAGPNNGDANGDNQPDCLQANVATTQDDDGAFRTLEVNGSGSTCDKIMDFVIHSEGSMSESDPNFDFPFQLNAFTIPCGGTVEVKLFYHNTTALQNFTYRKYGPMTPGGATSEWYDFPITIDQVTVGGNTIGRVSFQLTDGQRGDATGVDNMIVDPGGIAMNVNNGADCAITYDLSKTGDTYAIRLTSDTTIATNNNISDLAITLRAPTGVLSVGNILNDDVNVLFELDTTYIAPAESPNYDFLVFKLSPASANTTNINILQGNTEPLFSFENVGGCANDTIFLVGTGANFAAPTINGQDLSSSIGINGWDAPTCVTNSGGTLCTPTPRDTIAIHLFAGLFTNICLDTTIQLPNGVGNTSVLFQGAAVNAAVANTDSCVQLTAQNNFTGNDFVTVVFCDNVSPSICDTAVFNITVSEQPTCLINYFIEDSSGTFSFKMVSDTTWTMPQNEVVSAQFTIRTPTGSFELANLQNGIGTVDFDLQTTTTQGGFDYLNIVLQTLNTQDIPIVKGDTVCLFSFENSGACTNDSLYLIGEGSPIAAPIVGDEPIFSKIAIQAWGGGTTAVPACVMGAGVPLCPINPPKIDTIAININQDATLNVCIDSVLQLLNNVGTATICGQGTNVTVTVSNGDSCVDLTAADDFVGTELLCVVHCDAFETGHCDTTYLSVTVNEVMTDPLPCLFRYLIEASNGVYTVRLAVDTTINDILSATNSMLVAIRVPTSGFDVPTDSITSLLPGAIFENTSGGVFTDAEEPFHGYIYFDINGIVSPDYQKGDTLDLFSFRGTGCTGDSIHLVGDGANFPNPIVNGEEVTSYLSIGAFLADGGAPSCVSPIPVSICEPVIPPVPAPIDTLKFVVDFETATTVCIDSALQLLTSVGNATICGQGTNVTVAVTNGDSCVTLTPAANFSGDEMLCVVHCDTDNPTYCDTTYLMITVREEVLPTPPPIDTLKFVLDFETATTVCIDSALQLLTSVGNATICGQGTNVTVAVTNGDSCVTLTPAANFSGDEMLCVVHCDTDNPTFCDTTYLMITVREEVLPTPPPIDTLKFVVDFETTTTVCIDSALQLLTSVGNATICGQGTNVTIAVTNGDSCLTLTPAANFSGDEMLCVVHCDTDNPTYCDTTYLMITVREEVLPTPPPIDTLKFVLDFETTTTVCIDSALQLLTSVGNATICGQGTNVTVAVTNSDSCVTLTPAANFSGNEMLCVVHCDTDNPTYCDTTYLMITVREEVLPTPPPIDTLKFVLDFETATTVCIDSALQLLTSVGNATICGQGTNVTVAVTNGDSCVTLTPAANFSGNEMLCVVHCDNDNPTYCDTTYLMITVNPSDDTPPPPSEDTTCHLTFDLELNNGTYIVSVIPDTTIMNTTFPNPLFPNPFIPAPVNAMNITLRAPTGKLNIVNQIDFGTDREFVLKSSMINPASIGYDYFIFGLNDNNTPTVSIPITAGVKTELFSFQNFNCALDSIALVGKGSSFTTPEIGDENIESFAQVNSANLIVCVSPDALTPPALAFSSTNTMPTTDICNDGTITITATGGTGIYDYSIDGGTTWQFNGNFTGLENGTYQTLVRSTDSICIGTVQPVTLNNPACDTIVPVCNVVIVSIDTLNATCSQADGQITINATGNNLQYSINTGTTFQNSNLFMNVAAGIYNIVVRDSVETACEVNQTITLNGTEIPTIQNVVVSDSTDFVNNNGIITIFATANCDLQYSIDGGQNYFPGNSFTGLGIGTYNIVVTDCSGLCPITHLENPIIIEEPPICSVDAGIDRTICEGAAVSLSANGTGPTFSWAPTTGLSCSDCANPIANPTTTTTYVVMNSDGNCTATDTITINVAPSITADFTFMTSCTDLSVAFTDNSSTAGNIASWSWNFGDGSALNTNQNPNYTYFATGTYTISLTTTTENNCTNTISKTVEVGNGLTGTVSNDLTICAGDCTTLMASGGTNYQWAASPDLSATDIPNPVACPTVTTTYYVTISDGNGCSTTDSVTITIAAPTIGVSASGAACDQDNGSITIFAAFPNGGPLEFQIVDDGNWFSTNTFTNLAPGAYNVRIRTADGGCVTAFENNPVTINQVAAPSITDITITDLTGCETNNGIIDISASGSNALIYSIDDGMNWSNLAAFDNLAQGIYNVRVAYSDTSCVTDATLVELTAPTAPTILIATAEDPSTCESTDGRIIIIAEGIANQSLEYSIDGINWQSSNIIENLAAGTYPVFARYDDGTCATQWDILVDLQPAAAPNIIDVTSTDPSAFDLADGEIFINAVGNAAIEYSIDSGETWQPNPDFIGLDTGSYFIFVRYLDGSCPTPYLGNGGGPVVLRVGNCLTFVEAMGNDPSGCGANDGFVFVIAEPFANVEYSINNGLDWQSVEFFENLSAGTYQILARRTDIACQIALDSTITLGEGEDLEIFSVDVIDRDLCNNFGGEIFINTNIFNNIEYSIDNGENWQPNNFFENVDTGTYTVLARSINLLCQATFNQPVVVRPVQNVEITNVFTSNPTSCGNLDGEISIETNAGFNTEYSIDNGATWTFDNHFIQLPPGNYNIKIRTGSCEVDYVGNPVVLGGVNDFRVINPIPNMIACAESVMAISVTLSDSIAGFVPNNGSITNPVLNGNTLTFDAIITGLFNEYEIVFSNPLGCEVSEPFTIFRANDTEADFVVIEPYCKEMEVSLLFTGTATPMADLIWELDGGILVSSSPANDSLPAGHEIVVRWDNEGSRLIKLTVDDGGCIDDEYESIFVRKLPLADAGEDVSICMGGCAELEGSGTGVWYTWSPAMGLSSPDVQNPTACPTETTTYTLTVMSADGCVSTDEVTVNVETNFITTSQDVTICAGESANLSVSGSTNYTWSSPSTLNNPTSPNPVATPTETTTYSVFSMNPNGCMDTATVTVFVNPRPEVVACEDKTICRGDSIQLVVTTAAQYSWSPTNTLINPNSGTPTAFPTQTTTYTVTVTDENGCTNTDEVVVFVNTPPTVAASADVEICAGASTRLSASGAISYIWSPTTGLNNPNLSNPIATPIVTTTYTVTGTDANGCTDTDQVTVNVMENTGISAGLPVTICAGESTQLFASGGSNYQWSPAIGLSNPTIANPIANPSVTTTYTLTGMSANGCPAISIVTVFVNPKPEPVACEDKTICLGDSIQLIVTTHAQYSWSPTNTLSNPNSGTPIAFPTETTTYTVTVTDEFGCANTDEVVVFVNNPSAVALGPDITLCEGGQVPLDAGAGIAYQWMPATGLSNPTVRNPIATISNTITYTVLVTNQSGCVGRDEITITVNGEPNADAGPPVVLCPGETGQLQATGGVSYQWSPSEGLSDPNIANPLVTTNQVTTYQVTVTDEFGCTATDETLVVISLPLSINPTITDATCCGTGGTAELDVSGGFGNATFEWSPNVSNTSSATNLSPGFYKVVVEDAEKCGLIFTFEIKEDCNGCPDMFAESERCINDTTSIERICLPIALEDIHNYEILIDNNNYVPDHGCDFENLTAYSYALVEGQGTTGMYRVENWEVDGQMYATEVETMLELTNWMNTVDPTGNWINNASILTIIGGDPAKTYGTMKVIQLTKWVETMLQPNVTGVATSTVLEVDVTGIIRPMEIIITNELTCCSDTIILKRCGEAQPCLEEVIAANQFDESINCGETASICLDIPFSNITNYEVVANDNPFSGEIKPCDFDSMFAYSYFTLPGLGAAGPYQINAWIVDGQMHSGMFDNLQELAALMNQMDPTGNWILDESTLTLQGGKSTTDYGEMKIEQTTTGSIATLDINSNLIPMGTELTFANGNYEVLLISKNTGCQDRFLVNVTCDDIVTPIDTTTNPVDTTVTPIDTTMNPVDTTVTPIDTTMNPVDTTVTPIDTTMNPVDTTITPIDTTTNPVDTTVTPIDTTMNPVDTTITPIDTTMNPVDTTVTPIDTTMNPVDTTITPIDTTMNPVDTTVTPIDTTTQISCDFLTGEVIFATVNRCDSMVQFCLDIPFDSISNYRIYIDGQIYGGALSSCNTNTYVEVGVGGYNFKFENINTGCQDSIILAVNCQTNAREEVVELIEGDTMIYCPASENLQGDIVSIENTCPTESGSNATVILDTIDFCANVVGLVAGEEQACFVVCDANGVCDTTNVTIRVVPKSVEKPQANLDRDTTEPSIPITIEVLANDSIFGELRNMEILEQPSNGTAIINDDNTITYVPNETFCNSEIPERIMYGICNDNGCDTAMVEILVPCSQLEIMNGFSPNNDGMNDFFTIKGIQAFPENEVQIFNRWGTLVFRQKGYKNKWDGTFDNKNLPDGTYFYLLTIASGEKYSGFVQINR